MKHGHWTVHEKYEIQFSIALAGFLPEVKTDTLNATGEDILEGFGYKLTSDGGELIIASKPRPRQKLLFAVCVLAGILFTATAIATSQILTALGVLIIAVAVCMYLYRRLLVSSRERILLSDDGALTWVKVRGFQTEENRRTVRDITPDAEGYRFKVSTMVHDNPGSRVLEGYPAALFILTSRGEGAGYEPILTINTLDKDLDRLSEVLLDKLPQSYLVKN